MEQLKIQINNLIDLRKYYYSTVVLITTGILGLFFIEITQVKLVIMVLTGCYFDYVFFNKFLNTDTQIQELIRRL